MDSLKSQFVRVFNQASLSDRTGSTLSSMYGILLVCIYIAFAYTELVRFPTLNSWLETHGFFIYLYLLSSAYLIYLLLFVLRGTNKTSETNMPLKVVENPKVSNCITT